MPANRPRPPRRPHARAAAALAAGLALAALTPQAAEGGPPSARAGDSGRQENGAGDKEAGDRDGGGNDGSGAAVRVNQIGYLTGAAKVAAVVSAAGKPVGWRLRIHGSGTVAASGRTRVYGHDRASGDHLHHADFSRHRTPGRYVLEADGAGRSVPFSVRDRALYPALARDAMGYFYFHRMGTPVEARHLQHPAHAHDALHPGDASVPCYRRWCGKQRLDVRGAWADAGDFGVYPVNHALAAWTLLNLHERDPRALPDGSLAIPERSNGRPDILDETAYGSRFVPGMLPREGLASHKVHNHAWSGFPPESVAAENAMKRSAMPPSTNATYAVARTTAHLSRVLAPHDPRRAAALWRTAEDAWSRAEARPDTDYTAAVRDAEGGGDYEDRGNSDDRYAAAAELYLTGHRRADPSTAAYRTAVTGSRHYGEITRRFSWARTATTGTLSLLAARNDLPAADRDRMTRRLRAEVDRILAVLGKEGYPVPLAGDRKYPWGSNSAVVNRVLLLGTAHDLTGDRRYLRGAHRAMDYLMGTNALHLSYITGYGEHSETDLHDRWAWGRFPRTPFPRGWLAGGPNNTLVNDKATPKGRPAAKSYAGPRTAPGAWSSKENAVNWNAPLVWAAAFLDRTTGELTGTGRRD
ncbi:glycoside hydrolase family 9 protein [Streptomyces xinghaiensis]|uniref:glycoside hydrolase family 9 protein n=1 Tax=Streptomyces xinghaiensis TaxID=1038928 RepID=UPI00342202B6